MAYIKKINGYFVKDEEARDLATAAQTAANNANTKAQTALDTATSAGTTATNAVQLANAAQQKADSAYSLAQGRDTAKTFDSLFEGMDSFYVFTRESDETLPIGAQIFLIDQDSPDYWVGENNVTGATEDELQMRPLPNVGENDVFYAGEADKNGFYPEYVVGKYRIYVMETQKLDLSGYVTDEEFAKQNVTFSVSGEELTILKNGTKPFSA